MNEIIIKKRNAYLASFLGLIISGLGHLYTGKWGIAIAIPFAFILLIALSGWTNLVFLKSGYLFTALVSILLFLFVPIWSFRDARKAEPATLNKTQRWYFYVLYVFAVWIIHSAVVQNRSVLFGFETYHISATSMAPILFTNDYIMVDTWAYNNKSPEVGDLIVFKYPRDPSIPYVKRIIGKPGDHIAYYDKQLNINMVKVERNYIGKYQQISDPFEMEEYTETLAGHTYGIIHIPTRPPLDAE